MRAISEVTLPSHNRILPRHEPQVYRVLLPAAARAQRLRLCPGHGLRAQPPRQARAQPQVPAASKFLPFQLFKIKNKHWSKVYWTACRRHWLNSVQASQNILKHPRML